MVARLTGKRSTNLNFLLPKTIYEQIILRSTKSIKIIR